MNEESVYHIHFQQVKSNEIRKYGHKCQHIRRKENIVITYNLCEECSQFLKADKDERDDSSKNTWPGFLWALLSGSHEPEFGAKYRYHDVYSGKTLWQLIPRSMREWWIRSIQHINSFGIYPYEGCSLTTPEPIFHDKTDILHNWEEDYEYGEQAGLHRALRNEQVMMPNILCPFECSEYLRKAEYASWEVIIQRYLLKVVLPLNKDAIYRKFQSISPFYFLVGAD